MADMNSALAKEPRATTSNRPPGPNLKALLAELDRPLDEVDWRHTTLSPKEAPTSDSFLKRLRRERQHRRELHRAREAASKAFGVRPRLSARKRATLMLSGGAVGLAAFSSPVMPQEPEKRIELSHTDQNLRTAASMLRASDHFKKALIEEEGVRYTVYRDVAGYPTVGVGHLVRASDGLRPGDRIDEDQVMAFLDQDLAIAEQGVRDLVGTLPLHQHEFDALLDLVYNVGGGNVDQRRSPRLNAAIRSGDYEAIAEELKYTKAAGQTARGLEHRSNRRAAIFMQASYRNPRETAG